VEQIELLIDEKCRILNKTGTPKSSALHLANWMKGQLDKQQQQARLAAIARSQENVSAEDEQLIFNSDSEQDERITYWTRQQLEKRTKELNLAKENGGLSAKPNFGGKRLSGVEELSMSATSDIYSTSEAEGITSVISQSHSTTSDSQVRYIAPTKKYAMKFWSWSFEPDYSLLLYTLTSDTLYIYCDTIIYR